MEDPRALTDHPQVRKRLQFKFWNPDRSVGLVNSADFGHTSPRLRSFLYGKRPAMGMTPRRALWALIIISTALRLLWAAVLGAGNDEAYHYLYAVHPDWSYFDHPPMTMLIERIGPMFAGGVELFSYRLGFVFLFAGSTWVLFKWTARWYGEKSGFYAALALNVTA